MDVFGCIVRGELPTNTGGGYVLKRFGSIVCSFEEVWLHVLGSGVWEKNRAPKHISLTR